MLLEPLFGVKSLVLLQNASQNFPRAVKITQRVNDTFPKTVNVAVVLQLPVGFKSPPFTHNLQTGSTPIQDMAQQATLPHPFPLPPLLICSAAEMESLA